MVCSPRGCVKKAVHGLKKRRDFLPAVINFGRVCVNLSCLRKLKFEKLQVNRHFANCKLPTIYLILFSLCTVFRLPVEIRRVHLKGLYTVARVQRFKFCQFAVTSTVGVKSATGSHLKTWRLLKGNLLSTFYFTLPLIWAPPRLFPVPWRTSDHRFEIFVF